MGRHRLNLVGHEQGKHPSRCPMVPAQYLEVPLNNLKGQDNLGRLQNLALFSFVSGPHLMMLEWTRVRSCARTCQCPTH